MFNLKRPCQSCPFRKDVPGFLHPARAQEIADALLNDEWFACHKTLGDNEDGGSAIVPTSQHCAGAAAVMFRENRPNQMMRIGERLRVLKEDELDYTHAFESLDGFVAHHHE